MTRKYTADAFFVGVGGIELGFTQTNEVEVIYANEFDTFACKTYSENNPNVKLDNRDIHNIKASEVPDADIIMGGFPCQVFSIAGYRKGFADKRGTLFFELLRIINAKRPRVIFMENVKNLISHDNGNTFKVIKEALVQSRYYIKYQVLNSKEYGNIPQNRERIYIVGFKNKQDYDNFEFPGKIELTKTLRDIIDFREQKDEKYYYRKDRQKCFDELNRVVVKQDTVYQWRRKYVRENKSKILPTLTASMGTGGNNVPIILTDSGDIRKLTPREVFNGQGYPSSFKLPESVSDSQLYKQAGNSVTVPVIHRIAENIIKVLDKN